MPTARAEGSPGNRVARQVFTGLPPRYDRLAWLLSFGQDRRWRRAVVEHVAAARPGRVLDVATGPAGIALATARRTGASVVGVDLNEPMLRQGVRQVRAQGLADRVALAVARAEDLPFPDATFDALTFSYLLRYVDDPAATLRELGRVVRPGGTMASLEFFVPPAAPWRLAWQLYVRAVLPALGLLTGGPAWWRVGRFLSTSIPEHYQRFSLPEHVQAWERAGFRDVGWHVLSVGGGLVMWGTRA
jgi:demethylmenaquinone methyltransferase/2-methoxy-6-polyprenyl-1,4-benzoquinol methylase